MICPRCAAPLEAEALACPHCHALVFGAEVERLTQAATAAETEGAFGRARDLWRDALRRLPPSTKQAAWVLERFQRIQSANDAPPAAPSAVEGGDAPAKPADPPWVSRLGPLGPVLLALWKGKAIFTLLKLKSLLTLFLSMWFYAAAFGPAFGIGFVLLILVHELGHFFEIRRRGLPADMPVFLPGLGAYVRWQAMGVPVSTRAFVSLAGPLAGALSAAACLVVFRATGSPVWGALTRSGAWLNALNLIPVSMLDGGQAARALNRPACVFLLASALLVWFVTGEGVFGLVAIGAAWAAYTHRQPETHPAVLLCFVVLLAALGLVLHTTPGSGFVESRP